MITAFPVYIEFMISEKTYKEDKSKAISGSIETGKIGIFHLKKFWSTVIALRNGALIDQRRDEIINKLLLNTLGLGLHQALQYIYMNTPSFEMFEEWIIETAGKPSKLQVDRFNAEINKKPQSDSVLSWLETVDTHEQVLSDDDLSFWKENGYIILKNAISEDARLAAEKAIWGYIGANPDFPDSWYGNTENDDIHGIMVELIQHPALNVNRYAARIHKAFAQLWGTTNLWATADRCGFHPPQRDDHPFPGPDLHWDINFDHPLSFGTQGILYLTDTPAEQGALTLVPGFQHRLSDWLSNLKPIEDPQKQDLHSLGSFAVEASAGDMVIWHQALPHGSRPNLGVNPRIVQYINMLPSWNYKNE